MVVRFVRELRRRRVFRTAALYVVSAWLVLQVADVVFPGFGIPEAAIRVLVWTAVVGFPIALVFGWFFDIGAGGIRRTLPVGANGAERASPLTRSDYVILAAFLLVGGVLIYHATEEVLEAPDQQAIDTAMVLPKLENSIAVLPFDNISNDPDNDFFCDGMSDEILNKLSAFRELNVIGRTSSFAFKGSNYGIARISSLLGVRYLLQGSVRKYGDELRISAQLLDEGGRQVWSQSFDQQLQNVFDIQTEIADAVATTIARQIVPRASAAEPPSIEAYEYYVTGREWLHRRDRSRAKEALEQAVAVDPDFAEAHAELSICLLLGGYSREKAERAKQHITRALELKPGLLRARAAQGFWLLRQQPPDDMGAERILRDVLDQDPNMSDALLWLTGLLPEHGRYDEARAILERAHRIDPLHPSITGSLAQELVSRGEVEEAVRLLEQYLEQPKPSYFVFAPLISIYEYSGRLVDMNRTAKSLAVRLNAPHYIWLTASYAVFGQWSAADYWLARSMREFPNVWWAPFAPSLLPSWQGHHDEALQRFREVVNESGLQLAEQDPNVNFWFGALLARAGEYSSAIELLALLVRSDGPLGSSSSAGALDLDGAHALAWSYLRSGAESKAKPLLANIAQRCHEMQQAGRLHESDKLHYCAENALLRGDEEEALSLFEDAVNAGWRDYYVRQHDPYWASLRENARYRELMSMVKADVDRQRAEVERLDAEEDFKAKLDTALAASAHEEAATTRPNSPEQ